MPTGDEMLHLEIIFVVKEELPDTAWHYNDVKLWSVLEAVRCDYSRVENIFGVVGGTARSDVDSEVLRESC